MCWRTHDQTQRSAAQAIDRALVARNWLFGWYIVEYEQNGADRAKYGSQTLKRLSAALKTKIGRGFSVDALERMRRFYPALQTHHPRCSRGGEIRNTVADFAQTVDREDVAVAILPETRQRFSFG